MPRALVVEDDESVREAVSVVLQGAGFAVDTVATGAQALDVFSPSRWDLVVLDVALPEVDGFAVTAAIRRRSTVPIVLLGARAETADVVRGLELGADDFVTTPFRPAELSARARAALRRAADAAPPRWAVRDLVIDEDAFTVSRDGEELALSATETRLLIALAARAGHVLSREALLERVWGYDHLGQSRLVDMAVLRLRTKLGEPADPPPYVETVRSVGYRFAPG